MDTNYDRYQLYLDNQVCQELEYHQCSENDDESFTYDEFSPNNNPFEFDSPIEFKEEIENYEYDSNPAPELNLYEDVFDFKRYKSLNKKSYSTSHKETILQDPEVLMKEHVARQAAEMLVSNSFQCTPASTAYVFRNIYPKYMNLWEHKSNSVNTSEYVPSTDILVDSYTVNPSKDIITNYFPKFRTSIISSERRAWRRKYFFCKATGFSEPDTDNFGITNESCRWVSITLQPRNLVLQLRHNYYKIYQRKEFMNLNYGHMGFRVPRLGSSDLLCSTISIILSLRLKNSAHRVSSVITACIRPIRIYYTFKKVQKQGIHQLHMAHHLILSWMKTEIPILTYVSSRQCQRSTSWESLNNSIWETVHFEENQCFIEDEETFAYCTAEFSENSCVPFISEQSFREAYRTAKLNSLNADESLPRFETVDTSEINVPQKLEYIAKESYSLDTGSLVPEILFPVDTNVFIKENRSELPVIHINNDNLKISVPESTESLKKEFPQIPLLLSKSQNYKDGNLNPVKRPPPRYIPLLFSTTEFPSLTKEPTLIPFQRTRNCNNKKTVTITKIIPVVENTRVTYAKVFEAKKLKVQEEVRKRVRLQLEKEIQKTYVYRPEDFPAATVENYSKELLKPIKGEINDTQSGIVRFNSSISEITERNADNYEKSLKPTNKNINILKSETCKFNRSDIISGERSVRKSQELVKATKNEIRDSKSVIESSDMEITSNMTKAAENRFEQTKQEIREAKSEHVKTNHSGTETFEKKIGNIQEFKITETESSISKFTSSNTETIEQRVGNREEILTLAKAEVNFTTSEIFKFNLTDKENSEKNVDKKTSENISRNYDKLFKPMNEDDIGTTFDTSYNLLDMKTSEKVVINHVEVDITEPLISKEILKEIDDNLDNLNTKSSTVSDIAVPEVVESIVPKANRMTEENSKQIQVQNTAPKSNKVQTLINKNNIVASIKHIEAPGVKDKLINVDGKLEPNPNRGNFTKYGKVRLPQAYVPREKLSLKEKVCEKNESGNVLVKPKEGSSKLEQQPTKYKVGKFGKKIEIVAKSKKEKTIKNTKPTECDMLKNKLPTITFVTKTKQKTEIIIVPPVKQEVVEDNVKIVKHIPLETNAPVVQLSNQEVIVLAEPEQKEKIIVKPKPKLNITSSQKITKLDSVTVQTNQPAKEKVFNKIEIKTEIFDTSKKTKEILSEIVKLTKPPKIIPLVNLKGVTKTKENDDADAKLKKKMEEAPERLEITGPSAYKSVLVTDSTVVSKPPVKADVSHNQNLKKEIKHEKDKMVELISPEIELPVIDNVVEKTEKSGVCIKPKLEQLISKKDNIEIPSINEPILTTPSKTDILSSSITFIERPVMKDKPSKVDGVEPNLNRRNFTKHGKARLPQAYVAKEKPCLLKEKFNEKDESVDILASNPKEEISKQEKQITKFKVGKFGKKIEVITKVKKETTFENPIESVFLRNKPPVVVTKPKFGKKDKLNVEIIQVPKVNQESIENVKVPTCIPLENNTSAVKQSKQKVVFTSKSRTKKDIFSQKVTIPENVTAAHTKQPQPSKKEIVNKIDKAEGYYKSDLTKELPSEIINITKTNKCYKTDTKSIEKTNESSGTFEITQAVVESGEKYNTLGKKIPKNEAIHEGGITMKLPVIEKVVVNKTDEVKVSIKLKSEEEINKSCNVEKVNITQPNPVTGSISTKVTKTLDVLMKILEETLPPEEVKITEDKEQVQNIILKDTSQTTSTLVPEPDVLKKILPWMKKGNKPKGKKTEKNKKKKARRELAARSEKKNVCVEVPEVPEDDSSDEETDEDTISCSALNATLQSTLNTLQSTQLANARTQELVKMLQPVVQPSYSSELRLDQNTIQKYISTNKQNMKMPGKGCKCSHDPIHHRISVTFVPVACGPSLVVLKNMMDICTPETMGYLEPKLICALVPSNPTTVSTSVGITNGNQAVTPISLNILAKLTQEPVLKNTNILMTQPHNDSYSLDTSTGILNTKNVDNLDLNETELLCSENYGEELAEPKEKEMKSSLSHQQPSNDKSETLLMSEEDLGAIEILPTESIDVQMSTTLDTSLDNKSELEKATRKSSEKNLITRAFKTKSCKDLIIGVASSSRSNLQITSDTILPTATRTLSDPSIPPQNSTPISGPSEADSTLNNIPETNSKPVMKADSKDQLITPMTYFREAVSSFALKLSVSEKSLALFSKPTTTVTTERSHDSDSSIKKVEHKAKKYKKASSLKEKDGLVSGCETNNKKSIFDYIFGRKAHKNNKDNS